ncbi:hypothetical protein FYK55_03580 [Roseiconus nitratireducens]|uniref:Uncharacterized protein n=1 Tax=Roseiconus nitratireducens TaxID=2605748 RepID=A0A5M6DEL9_9BACT|nr:hypothetical protein [Roseiconus nitratireducens]KAA5546001.1 hypothetical protein FYK55_03580 [Roseiconus nitratireducens]
MHHRSNRFIDTAIFATNFSIATILLMACVIAIATADNPFSFLSGLFLVVPVLGYAIAEWACWYRERNWLGRPLGILNLLLAAFFLFAAATNVIEVAQDRESVDPWFLVVFGLGFGMFSAYLGYCGWRRIRRAPSP